MDGDKNNSNNNNEVKQEMQMEATKEKGGYWSRLIRAIRTKPHLFIIFFISILGFCYHFNIALAQYWEYKTTVSYTNEDPKDYKYQYPSATICFQDVVPYFKLKEKFPEYKDSVDRINAEMERLNDSNYWTKPATAEFVKITGIDKLEGKP